MSFWDDVLIKEEKDFLSPFIDLTTLDVLNILKANLKPSELEEFKRSL